MWSIRDLVAGERPAALTVQRQLFVKCSRRILSLVEQLFVVGAAQHRAAARDIALCIVSALAEVPSGIEGISLGARKGQLAEALSANVNVSNAIEYFMVQISQCEHGGVLLRRVLPIYTHLEGREAHVI